jgi:RNA polymerase sigma-70 factor (ECF subfamily)
MATWSGVAEFHQGFPQRFPEDFPQGSPAGCPVCRDSAATSARSGRFRAPAASRKMAAPAIARNKPVEAPSPDDAEQSLLRGLRAREARACNEAVRRYTPVMLAVARPIVGSAHAEDVVQDAWISALDALDRFEGRSSLKSWLLRIVTNKAISRLRGKREVAMSELMADDADDDGHMADWFDARGHWNRGQSPRWHDDTPEALLATQVLQRCLDSHLQKLPEAQRTALVLRDMQGMEMNEVCTTLGTTEGNVRVMLHRARLKLVAMVNHFEETGEC